MTRGAWVLGLSWTILLLSCPPARACGPLGPDDPLPPPSDDVEMETALIIYGVSAGATAILVPAIASSVDQRDAFPLLGTLGISLATGFGGFLLALAASAAQDSDDPCGNGSDLQPEQVAIFDLLPVGLAALPTLVTWNLSGASASADAPTAAMGVELDGREGRALIWSRVRF